VEVTKVRGKHEVKIRIGSIDTAMAKRLGIPLEEYVRATVDQTAKKRRWNWRKSSIEDK